MPGGKKPGPSVRDDETCEALRREGNREERSARIAIAAANTSRTKVVNGGSAPPSYAEWSKSDVISQTRELDSEESSSMSKGDRVDAPRNHRPPRCRR